MKAYSYDLRRAVIAAYERHRYSQPQVAEVFGISPATVRNWVRRKRETGSPDAFPHAGGAKARLSGQARERVRQLVKESNAVLLSELCERISREFRRRVSESTMCRVVQAMGLSRKKGRSTPVNATRRGCGTPARHTGEGWPRWTGPA